MATYQLDGTPLLPLLLAWLAALRCWRLLAIDDVTARFRAVLRDLCAVLPHRLGDAIWHGWFCPFCLGFWLTLGWTVTAFAWSDRLAWQIAAATLAGSWIVGQLGSRADGGGSAWASDPGSPRQQPPAAS